MSKCEDEIRCDCHDELFSVREDLAKLLKLYDALVRNQYAGTKWEKIVKAEADFARESK